MPSSHIQDLCFNLVDNWDHMVWHCDLSTLVVGSITSMLQFKLKFIQVHSYFNIESRRFLEDTFTVFVLCS